MKGLFIILCLMSTVAFACGDCTDKRVQTDWGCGCGKNKPKPADGK